MSINTVIVTPLPRIQVKGGDVLKVLKSDESSFASFGEAYFSWINSGNIKAWKRHTRMVMNLIVPVGMVRFVFHLENEQPAKNFRVIDIGKDNYARITVPFGIWFGFQGLEKPHNLVLNVSNILHQPDEVERKSLNEIKFDWNLKK